MKRWNGWGYANVEYPLKPEAWHFLRERVGAGRKVEDAKLADVVKSLPNSRLKSHPLITTHPEDRIRHSTGQSLSDWITMRGGRYSAFVDGVAYPTMPDEVRDLIAYCKDTGTHLIPYGGGTSVVGHLTPLAQDAPVLSLDMSRMCDLIDFDPKSQLATFQAGIAGPDIEAKLRARGYTLGHYPQSFEFSTLGGWVATRSSGQQSRFYGRIEGLFAGGTVETPLGTLDLAPFPASAAGPDLREMVLGSEGRLGVITEATVCVSRIPQHESFGGIAFPSFEQGMEAVRVMAQANLPVSMLRLSNAVETQTNLAVAGGTGVRLLERYLAMRGVQDEKCMLIYGLTGTKRVCGATRRALVDIARQHGGVFIGALMGNPWRKNRFRSAYLRNTLWDHGYAVDTLETATTWTHTPKMMQDIEQVIRTSMAEADVKTHVFTHLSHVYPTGTSVYTTYVFALGETSEQTLERWQWAKAAASEAVVSNGGTISHQHGVGLDHAPYLSREKGTTGIQALQSLIATFDPSQIMNPGKLLQEVREDVR
jgi:alkyldihydroxyacetonephosphate synthase